MTETALAIDKVQVGDRARKDLGNLSWLEESIKAVGLLHPIVVDPKWVLIAGQRRLEACKQLGWKEVPIHQIQVEDILKAELHENTVRKDFTVSEMVAIKRRFEPEVREAAEARKKAGIPSDESSVGDTRDILGRYFGIAGQTIERAEAIVEAAEKDHEQYGSLLENVDAGRTSIAYAFSTLTRPVPTPNLPEGEFNIIYADPPWKPYVPLRGAPKYHYPVMELDAIKGLKVPSAESAVLFLWTPNTHVKEALEVMEAWGFDYATNMVWIKDKWGTGYYFRGQHELLLLGNKGDMPSPRDANRPSSVLHAPRREHSQKPDEAYGIIEKMYPGCKYLEMFARQKRKGWTVWGNEVA